MSWPRTFISQIIRAADQRRLQTSVYNKKQKVYVIPFFAESFLVCSRVGCNSRTIYARCGEISQGDQTSYPEAGSYEVERRIRGCLTVTLTPTNGFEMWVIGLGTWAQMDKICNNV